MLDLVLVFETDSLARRRLEQVLLDNGAQRVDLVASTREVIMAADRERHDLLILPLEHGPRLVRSLRALQPDCPILLSTPVPEASLPAGSVADFQGLLFIPRLETELPRLLVKSQPAESEAKEKVATP